MQRSPQQGAAPVASPAVAIGPAVADSPAVVANPAAGLPTSSPYLIDITPLARDASTDLPEFQVETVNAMRLKPPELDTADIHTFFYALENWFDAWNIHPHHHVRRFNILKTQIPTRILPELRPILDSVPNIDRYESAKKAIIQHFEESQRSRLHRLLSEMSLGDRKPSQLLAEMRRTANGAMTDSMLIDLWIGRLPPYVQSAVIASSQNADEKVKVADSVVDSFALYNRSGPYQTIAEVRNEEVNRLSRQVAELSQRLETLMNQNQARERSRARSRSLNRNTNQATNPNTNGYCFYHDRYGQQARNCRAPCSFNSRPQNNGTPTTSA
ncbi:uncharacterized protein LOC121592254 [Anopheles merus]|uniref:uncharacterized protein LOC121592254 n=1 Tax=Anopheles merus TaxID=30066 RepID=UPI001BE416D8|nr:uncharacterized protein LOC121592254 [Anopheles merus]